MINQGAAPYKQWLVFTTLILAAWLILNLPSLTTAVQIWTISEIFNHCYIVLPASLYLMWEKRSEIDWQLLSPTLLPLPILLGQLVVFLFGLAGDINVLMHIATFTMLPVLIWMLVGHKIAQAYMFPLAFMVFAIPIGEELVPFLQEITADYSVMLLQLTGIPLYRSGLFIEIPQGKFLVAEACSGISFLIASIVLGNLYAYMNLKSMKTRVLFVFLSIIFPIFANVLRVYGIILIGYSSNMEHAVGADHLIYGWFFFAFVLVCLFLIGEVIRKRELRIIKNKGSEKQAPEIDKNNPQAILWNVLWIVPLLLLSMSIYKGFSLQTAASSANVQALSIHFSLEDAASRQTQRAWQPDYQEAISTVNSHYLVDGVPLHVYAAVYHSSNGELISSQNKLFSEKNWSRVSLSSEVVNSNLSANKLYISAPGGDYRRVYSVYIVNDVSFTNRTYAKLYETWLKLVDDDFYTGIIAMGVVGNKNESMSQQEAKVFSQLHTELLSQIDGSVLN